MEDVRKGGCLCGGVRYETWGEPLDKACPLQPVDSKVVNCLPVRLPLPLVQEAQRRSLRIADRRAQRQLQDHQGQPEVLFPRA